MVGIGLGMGIGRGSSIPAPKIIVQDSFNRADNASTLGTADSGQVWAQHGTSGCGISQNRAYSLTTGGFGAATVQSGESDVSVSADIFSNHVNASIILFRVVDTVNYFTAEINNAGQLNINRKLANVNSTLDSKTVAYAPGKTLKVTCTGSTFLIYYDGVLQLQITDTNLMTGTKHGIAFWANNVSYIDNFKVTK